MTDRCEFQAQQRAAGFGRQPPVGEWSLWPFSKLPWPLCSLYLIAFASSSAFIGVHRRFHCLSLFLCVLAVPLKGVLKRILCGSAFFLSPRMRRIINFRQVLKIEMRINLRRRDARMPEHLLHRAQVAA